MSVSVSFSNSLNYALGMFSKNCFLRKYTETDGAIDIIHKGNS